MNKERAIEQIKKLIKFTKKAREVIGTPQKDIEIVIGENQFYLSDELLQALDIAIESLDENERLKKERDYILEKAKEELKDNEWVDVRDRLPSESGYYVVTREYNNWGVIKNEVRQFYFNGEKWLTDFEGFDITPEVVAWKKVEPYERDKKKV